MPQPLPQAASDSQLLNLRVPPHSIDAEQSVLGGLLIDNGAFDKIGDVVTDGDFYRDDHRRIFRHVSRLIERGKPADVVTVDEDRKSTRLNSSHLVISYAVFCLKKKKQSSLTVILC